MTYLIHFEKRENSGTLIGFLGVKLGEEEFNHLRHQFYKHGMIIDFETEELFTLFMMSASRVDEWGVRLYPVHLTHLPS